MTLNNLFYKNSAGTWVAVQRPYVKRNGVWAPVKEAWVKDAGVWKKSFEWDITPPSPPSLALELFENLGSNVGTNTSGDGRYIRVGVRMPETANVPDVSMIRILVGTATAYPSSWADATHIKTVDNDYPYEFWSDLVYNGFQDRPPGKYHPDTSQWIYKNYPPNASTSYNLPGGRYYKFQAWARDFDGNWSGGTPAQIWVPSSFSTANQNISMSANFIPTTTSYKQTSSGVVKYGTDLIASGNPVSRGYWNYAGAIIEGIGARGTPTISSALIYVQRKNDNGAPLANVYLGRSSSDTTATEPVLSEITKVGTLGKGQGKWLPIPTSWYPELESDSIRTIGLYHKDPAKATANPEDYIEVVGNSLETGVSNSGRLYVVWKENL